MAKSLLIVESPAKAKTLGKYLTGMNFEVVASYGHVRDLPAKKGSVLPDNQFAIKYVPIERNIKHVEEICHKLKSVKDVYLATDPDREGEAIAWHLCEIMRERKALEGKNIHRVIFHEITPTAVKAALAEPRTLAMDLVNAQQARRALDYLVGFNLSPLLWKKVRRGLSAGRVQSPALRMIVERQDEIDKFQTQEYWTIRADLKSDQQAFTAKLIEYQGEKQAQFSVTTAEEAEKREKILFHAAEGHLIVQKIQKTQRKRQPAPPFTTSTLQQEASRKLGFTTQRTMRIAQQLYEGIDVGHGAVGLITYMRTDSVSLAQDAIQEIRSFIGLRYGKDHVPTAPRIYKTKSKNAQEAHEAIRPTLAEQTPESIRTHLSIEQYKLYQLIWKRAVASQMMHAVLDLVSIEFSCGVGNRFKTTGSTLTFPGFIAVYTEGVDDAKLAEEEDDKLLPPLKEGEKVSLEAICGEQHFTEPPPRFTEASLVKTLEEYGIGRPSTYASIISTLQQREYVVLENKRFMATDVGKIVIKFLTQFFTQYVDYDFTAHLEDDLDAVARGERLWIPVLENFWTPFINLIQTTEENVKRADVTHEAMEEACPKCEKPLSIRLGKRGRFIGCTGYPECAYTRNLEQSREESLIEPVVTVIEGRQCPKCQGDLVMKRGRYGQFIGCSQYPACKHMESLDQATSTQVACPSCHKGNLIKKKSRFGTFFYPCTEYPECRYALRFEPVPEACPKCQWPILMSKVTKRWGTQKACPQKECGYIESTSCQGSA